MADKIKNIKGSLILLLAAFIWGTAFVAQTSGADSVGTFTFNTCRSVVGALFLLLVIVLLDSYGKRTSGGGKDTIQELYSRTKWPVKGGVLCGIILFVAMSLQQYGISIYPAGVAASGRAGFLTATYVVLVAICSVLPECIFCVCPADLQGFIWAMCASFCVQSVLCVIFLQLNILQRKTA